MCIVNLLKRISPQLALITIICVIAAFSYVKSEIIDVDAKIKVSRTVIIDAGHGGLTNTTD